MAMLIMAVASMADLDELDGTAPYFGLVFGFSSAFMAAWVLLALACGWCA